MFQTVCHVEHRCIPLLLGIHYNVKMGGEKVHSKMRTDLAKVEAVKKNEQGESLRDTAMDFNR